MFNTDKLQLSKIKLRLETTYNDFGIFFLAISSCVTWEKLKLVSNRF